MIRTFRAIRNQKIAGSARRRRFGELVPEAHFFRLPESLLRSGFLEEIAVSEDDFRAAIYDFCPNLRERLQATLGVEIPEPISLTKAVTEQPAAPEQPAHPAKKAPAKRPAKKTTKRAKKAPARKVTRQIPSRPSSLALQG